MEPSQDSKKQRQALLFLCRFLALRLLHKVMLVLLSVTGLILSLLDRTQFAPYGIAILCLLLPSFICGSSSGTEKKGGDAPLSDLYDQYHCSPVAFFSYRITFLLCSFLLLFWHFLPNTPLLLRASLPLIYLAINLGFYPVTSLFLFWYCHRRLMDGGL